jgi:hypothetical protein
MAPIWQRCPAFRVSRAGRFAESGQPVRTSKQVARLISPRLPNSAYDNAAIAITARECSHADG